MSTTRTAALAVALLAAALRAQDGPLIHAEGPSLETFDIALRLMDIDHRTAEGLAKSFARFQEEQHGVRRRFAELFRDAHLDLMRVHYAGDLVEKQAKAYDAQAQKGYRCEVVGVTPAGDAKATATLRRSYVEAGKKREESSEVDLARDPRGWWISAIRDRAPDGSFVERDLGSPPALARVPVPPQAPPDLTSAKTAIASLRDATLRLGALRDNASLALQDRFFDITAAFYGEEAAQKAREGRGKPEPPTPSFVQIGDPKPRLADLVRIEVVVREEVPGRPDLRSAIGEAAFDLRPSDGRWKIVGEHTRPAPDKAFSPATRNFGLFFLVRR
jgi:hypothetical protein